MKTVCICGSTKFKPEVLKFVAGLEKLGATVFHYAWTDEKWKDIPAYKDYIALGLTHEHFYKIRMSDIIFIYNKNGYSGNSTTMEIGYAAALGKPIYALSDKDEELCRIVLMRGFAKTPKELIKILK